MMNTSVVAQSCHELGVCTGNLLAQSIVAKGQGQTLSAQLLRTTSSLIPRADSRRNPLSSSCSASIAWRRTRSSCRSTGVPYLTRALQGIVPVSPSLCPSGSASRLAHKDAIRDESKRSTRRRSRVSPRSSLQDPAEIAEAAQSAGEHLSEGGGETLAKTGQAIIGAVAAGSVVAGNVGKVVGKATSLVRDAYGPKVQDQISNGTEEDSGEFLEQVKGAVGAIQEYVQEEDTQAFLEQLSDISDEVKLAAGQAGLAAVAAAGAALRQENAAADVSGSAATGRTTAAIGRSATRSTASATESRKGTEKGPSAQSTVDGVKDKVAGATPVGASAKGNEKTVADNAKGGPEEVGNGSPKETVSVSEAGGQSSVKNVERLVASEITLEAGKAPLGVSDAPLPVSDVGRLPEPTSDGPALVVVDALKERLADFAGGVEEEIKRKQADRAKELAARGKDNERGRKSGRRGNGQVSKKEGLPKQTGATRVRVGRERHIPVNKADLIPAMRELFEPGDAAGFVAVCTSVESILHAEHQVIMEELRADFALTHADESDDDAAVSKEAEMRAAEIDREGGVFEEEFQGRAEASSEKSEDEPSGRASFGAVDAELRDGSDGADSVRSLASASVGKRASKAVQKLLGVPEKNKAWAVLNKVKNAVSEEGDGSATRAVLNKVEDAVTDGVSETDDGSATRAGENGAGRVGKIVLAEPGRGSLVQTKFSDVADEGRARRSAREDAMERFETNVLEILSRGQFEALTSRDLELTAALNEDYLLTLPINVDWASSSKEAIIFRRGYSVERESGRMTGPKTDFLQSIFLQGLFRGATRPLYEVGTKIRKTYHAISTDKNIRPVLRKVERWLGEPLPVEGDGEACLDAAGPAITETRGGPVTVPRYEAFLSSAGSRGLLIKKLLVSLGLVPEEKDKLAELAEEVASREADLSPRYVSRVSMADVFRPSLADVTTGGLLDRVKATARVMFADTTLLEPAYREMVILYTPKPSESKPTLWQRWVRRPKDALQRRFRRRNAEVGSEDGEDEGGEPGGDGKLQLNMYKDIPIPELKVVFPDKKLSYRLLDTVRLDLTTILGIVAFGLQYRFDDLNSISNFILDAITFASLSYFLFRTSLSYARTFDRYRLLVNKTLYEKTLASGFGVIHFIVDASEDQQFKEAALAYGLLLKADTWQTQEQLARACVEFLEQRCGAQILMPVDRALDTLLRLGLAESATEGDLERRKSAKRSPESAGSTNGTEEDSASGASEIAETQGSADGVALQTSGNDLAAVGETPVQATRGEAETEGKAETVKTEADGTQRSATEPERNATEPERTAVSASEEAGTATEAETLSAAVYEAFDSDVVTEFPTREPGAGQVLYRAVKTGEALPGLEMRWLGLLMRPSVWALNKQTH